ncbi:MAG: hypothetical protein QE493_02065 [Verrucomicrobiae bacterium]|nr:hypothetical protein [Verrucomicrobiae bacterium]
MKSSSLLRWSRIVIEGAVGTHAARHHDPLPVLSHQLFLPPRYDHYEP